MKHSFKQVAVAIGLVLGLVAGGAQADEVKAAVAANFTDVTKKLTPIFKEKTGHDLVASFGSSGKLTSQIENGAPFEVFLSADAARPKRLAESGMASTPFTYAVGKLALWSADPAKVDGEGEVLKSEFSKLAIANPKTAPYGAAAMEVLANLKLADSVTPRLVQGDSIAQTFQFVSTGNAEIGFVALSQVKALAPEEAGSVWVVPQELYAPIKQDATLLKKGEESAAAKAFLEFLQSPEAKAVIEQYGYGTE